MASRYFLRVIVVFFAIQSAWIALSALYPQAFDEQFHFGLIKVYSHYWLPLISSQPQHANSYGAVARDPSYLYHYLMSFPYRLITIFTSSQTAQVIILRFINIAMAVVGLLLFRLVLIRVGLSKAVANVSSFLYALIPVVPQLAGQINYDNLLIPLTAWAMLLCLSAVDQLKSNRPDPRTFLGLLALCFFTVLVQYEFLPIFLAMGIYLIFLFVKNPKKLKLKKNFVSKWNRLTKISKFTFLAILIISFGLFMQRDGFNLVKYHTFNPNCSAVVSPQACSAYSVWQASNGWHEEVIAGLGSKITNPLSYTGTWVYWLWYRLFFAVNGQRSHFTNYPPLPLPIAAAGLLGIAGVVLPIARRRIFRDVPYLRFLLLVVILYCLFLLGDGYLQYRYTHVLVLMNGRYLLPIMFFMIAILACALRSCLTNLPKLKVWLTIAVMVAFLDGGGLFTFIARSDASWDWPNTTIVRINNAARDVIRPIIFDGPKTYTTRDWWFN